MSEQNRCGECKFFKERIDSRTNGISKFGKCMKDSTWDKTIEKPYFNKCRFLPTKDFGCILFEPKS